MNKSFAARSPWLKFLRDRRSFAVICKELKDAAKEYRQKYGVNPKAKTAAQKRLTKIERAIEAVKDPAIQSRLSAEFGDRYSIDYVNAVVKRLEQELTNLKELIAYGSPKLSTEQKGSGYGLLSGLGYGEGYGYFIDVNHKL
jgi:hypothetical protein